MPDINKKETPAEQEQVNRPVTPEQVPGQVEVSPTPEIVRPAKTSEIKEIETEKEAASTAAPSQAVVQETQAKPETVSQIENILAEDLEDIYFNLPPEKQAEFKKTGEETASKISQLLSQAKVQVRKILDLIRDWLKVVPGINKYFLEQEAKIKTDKILDLKDQGQTGQENQNKI